MSLQGVLLTKEVQHDALPITAALLLDRIGELQGRRCEVS